MNKEDHLQIHIELCKRIYKRLKRDGDWPWEGALDSPKSVNVLESKNNNIDT